MTTHHCGTYPNDPYCNCYNDTGGNLYHYKQFDSETQTFNCCDQITVSLKQLKPLADPVPGTITKTPEEFFSSLSSEGLTGCCYEPYFKNPETGSSDENYFINNYPALYNDYLTTVTLYNQYLKNNIHPVTENNFVKCSSGNYPYVISYKSPGQVYEKYSYICSNSSNDVFSPLSVGYGDINYNVTRFYDNSTGQPCTNSSCQLAYSSSLSNYGDVNNLGNQQPVYKNKGNKFKPYFITSGVIATILFLVIAIYLFYYKFHKKLIKT